MASQLPPLIEALLDPMAYDHPAQRVEVIQTHISYVLLAGEFAYKIKKPIDLGFVDYSTLDRRKLMCEEEVRLNRRLCAGVYLGVVPVVRIRDSYRIAADGGDEAVEYAVKMRRVSSDRMMPRLLDRTAITGDHIRAIARRMAQFHAAAETSDRIAAFGRTDAVWRNWQENFEQTASSVGGPIHAESYRAIRSYVEQFLREHAGLLNERAASGRVRDCHGDLRTDAIVIGEDGAICIMDCIEFNDRIRYGDVASDIAFLAMDLEFRGHAALAHEVAAAYLNETNDETLPLVWSFYRCYRAYVRAKVESLLILEPEVADAEKASAAARARGYAVLAQQYATGRYPQVLVMMVGLSGTGKSYLAGALAAHFGSVILRSDVVRKARMDVDRSASAREELNTGAYTPRARADVYSAMHDRARDHLSRGRAVILDATYISRTNRDDARRLAAEGGVPLLAVEVAADELLVRAQLAQREQQPGGASDAGWRVYLAQRGQFEVPDEIPPHQKIRLDASRPLDANISLVTSALREQFTDQP
ncbi:MAG: AAA family ATPase [Chloroflexota bacterium]|nr:AAA family ATPase [Chloroflexota bacterium]